MFVKNYHRQILNPQIVHFVSIEYEREYNMILKIKRLCTLLEITENTTNIELLTDHLAQDKVVVDKYDKIKISYELTCYVYINKYNSMKRGKFPGV